MVAVDNASNYPATAPKTTLSGITPNAEAIVAYNPDLVVISNDENGIVKALGELHIRVLLEPAVANLAGVYAQLKQLGALTGHAAQAGCARRQDALAGDGDRRSASLTRRSR